MAYFVIETQANGETASGILTTHSSEGEAEQKYHLILSAAAVSQIEKHGAILIRDDLRVFKREIYDRTNPEPLEGSE